MTTDTKTLDKKTAERRAARGTKRTCQNSECEQRFYDLNRDPIQCPQCNAAYVVEVAPPPVVKRAPAPAPAKPAPVVAAKEVDEDAEEVADIATDDKDAGDDAFLDRDDEEEAPAVADIVGTAGKDDATDT